ncbi:MAG: Clp protease ClpP [Succinivibrionaceae bacterium]|nr:Clp protease ClpP [Succinivibrionaceae bacterium]
MDKFWNWSEDEAEGVALRISGPIDDAAFWGDEVTPDDFRKELNEHDGDVTVYINSPGGSVFAAAEIYTMLREHRGKVTVKIDTMAASAASVVSMAGDVVMMSPTAVMMIHDPATIAVGTSEDIKGTIKALDEIKETIINAYELKTGLSRKKIADMMTEETWMNAGKAKELGFIDQIMFVDVPAKKEGDDNGKEEDPMKKALNSWSTTGVWQTARTTITNIAKRIENRQRQEEKTQAQTPESVREMGRVPAESRRRRLETLMKM